jgi:hypothetical protein
MLLGAKEPPKQGPLENFDSNTGDINVAQAIYDAVGDGADDVRPPPKPG